MSRNTVREERRALSLVLAIGMHSLIAALLFFGVQWHTHPAAPMEVEMWVGAVEPAPAPPTVVKPQPVTPPKPVVEEKPEPPPVAKPDIVEPQKQPQKKPPEKKPEPKKPEPVKEPPKPVPPPKPVEPPKKQEPVKKPSTLADIAKEPAKAEVGKGKHASDKQGKLEKPPIDASVSLNAIATRLQAADAAGKAGAMDAYYGRVRNMIRHNMNYPDDAAGNPEAIFTVTLLPDMTVLDVKLQKSSGVPAFDEAVKRAILKTKQYPPMPAGVDFGTIRQHNLKYKLRDE